MMTVIATPARAALAGAISDLRMAEDATARANQAARAGHAALEAANRDVAVWGSLDAQIAAFNTATVRAALAAGQAVPRHIQIPDELIERISARDVARARLRAIADAEGEIASEFEAAVAAEKAATMALHVARVAVAREDEIALSRELVAFENHAAFLRANLIGMARQFAIGLRQVGDSQAALSPEATALLNNPPVNAAEPQALLRAITPRAALLPRPTLSGESPPTNRDHVTMMQWGRAQDAAVAEALRGPWADYGAQLLSDPDAPPPWLSADHEAERAA